jgi:hypothetical protein
VRRGRRSLLSPPLYGRGPIPLRLQGVDVTAPYLRSIAAIYCGVATKQDRRKHLEGSLASSVHTGGHGLADVYSTAVIAIVSMAWIWGHGGDVIHVQPRIGLCCSPGGHQLCPLGPATVLHRFLVHFGPGLIPMANSPGPGPPDVHFAFLTCQHLQYIDSGLRTGWH